MIGVLDYGMGNLFSVSAALDRLGVEHQVSSEHEVLEKATGIIVPGVGSFRDAMNILNDNNHTSFLKSAAQHKPVLGICLGMQLLFETSEENGLTDGLSLLPGKVERFKGFDEQNQLYYKVPHMGWNNLTFHDANSSPLMQEVDEDYVYFVHSYRVITDDNEILLASADYHGIVPAVVGRGNVFGTQFHPEKSGTAGMAILKNFCSISSVKGVRG